MTTPNPDNIKDGEMLPIVGGPYDGQESSVSVLFPFLNGGAPSSMKDIDGHRYMREGRKWVYVGKVER